MPLRKAVQIGNQEITEIWDIPTLLQTIPALGAVIDLTNTTRYYNPSELKGAGILHRKILIPGHMLPPENKVKEFMDAVDEFLGKDCETLVGVHCTHGLNRTGYMVCRYMRDRLGIAAIDAIKKFEVARGYKIERDNYITDLISRKLAIKPVIKKPTNGESECSDKEFWSEKCTDGLDDDYNGGRYVRHPKYVIRNGQKNHRIHYSKNRRKSTDSDRPYDFKHDY